MKAPQAHPSPSSITQKHINDQSMIKTSQSFAPCITITTTNDTNIIASATTATSTTVPLLAGNLPRITHDCATKYRRAPSSSVRILIPRNVAPSGLPKRRSVALLCEEPEPKLGSSEPPVSDKLVLRRKSCVTAMPMDAKAREVRSQARKVRSEEIRQH